MALVLIVDDEVQVARSIERLLRRGGYEVRTAQSGAEALALLDGVDVLLTDLRMAGMSGLELVAEVNRRRPEVRCCVMSGDGGSAGLELAAAARLPTEPIIAARLGKPFANDELLAMLARVRDPQGSSAP